MFVTRIGNAVVVHAPAKLNLLLAVLAKRNDGYHELETLMSAVEVFDTLSICNDPTGAITLHCRWAYGWAARSRAEGELGDLPTGGGNIVVRTLECLRQNGGIESGAKIELVKRIPSAAGMGGASSDAAAALVAANEIWNLRWPTERLATVAAQVGSDVPFFLYAGLRGSGAAVCRGRGEQIEQTFGLTRLNYVVVKPCEGLSTPEVFKQCRPTESPVSAKPLVEAARHGNPTRIARELRNDLERPASSLSSRIEGLLAHLERVGSLGSRMSGSGSSCFGLFRHRRQARRAAQRLRAVKLGAVYVAATAAAPGRRVRPVVER